MLWVALLALYSVAAQPPSQPLLPAGVNIAQVTQISTYISGTVQFVRSQDGSSTYSTLLSYPVSIGFDNTTGILTVRSAVASAASMLKPGLLAGFLAVGLCLSLNANKNSALLGVMLLGLGVVTAASVNPDFVISVPGCFHTVNNGTTLLFDHDCLPTNLTNFTALAVPQAAVQPVPDWAPVDPATAFGQVTDAGMHSLHPENQFEVWRQNFGKTWDLTALDNFFDFTARCKEQNGNATRDWTAGCNQFSDQSHDDWKTAILAGNAAAIAAGVNGRRLLDVPFLEVPEAQRRKLLAVSTFSWVGTGKLTPVKDQGQCGSCYAHSTSSQMEAALTITYGIAPAYLSREQLKDCSNGSPGCDGGSPSYMFTYAAGQQGLAAESSLAYKATNQLCPSPVPAQAFSDTGYTAISNTEADFQVAVQTAPIAVTVCADTWDNYAGGVFSNCTTNCQVDHAVLLVGFGTDSRLGDYWLIQNSWNTWWGEAGFIRMPNTHSSTAGVGMCGLTQWPGYQAKNPKAPNTGTNAPTTAATRTPTRPPVTTPTTRPPTNQPTKTPTRVPTGSAVTAAPTIAVQPCIGTWTPYGPCSVTCGGGTQTKTWITTTPPSGGGTPCPNPTTQSRVCNTNLCSSGSGSCVHLSNTVLANSGDGDYSKTTDWNQGWCITGTNPQYTRTNNNGQVLLLFWYNTNCYTVNGVSKVTAGCWGLGPQCYPGQAYQWSDTIATVNGVPPGPENATGWTISVSAGTTC